MQAKALNLSLRVEAWMNMSWREPWERWECPKLSLYLEEWRWRGALKVKVMLD